MSANTKKMPVGGGSPASNLFQRAAARLGFRKRTAEQVAPVAEQVGPAAAMTVLRASSPPQTRPAAVPSVPVEPAAALRVVERYQSPAALAALLTPRQAESLIGFAKETKGQTADAGGIARLRSEVEARGGELTETAVPGKEGSFTFRIGITGENFNAMPHSQRNEFMASGGYITPPGTRTSNAHTPVSVAADRRIRFPIQPPAGPSWRQYLAYTDSQVAAVEAETGKEFGGELARMHLYDARASLRPTSWRYDGATYDDEQSFRKKFNASLIHCTKFGPWWESPNDPAPALNPNAMTAEMFLKLRRDGLDTKLKRAMADQWGGRVARAELKRALETASDAMYLALLESWGFEIAEFFPDEWVWPVGYKH